MKTVMLSGLIAATLVLTGLAPLAAQTARFRHLISIYLDDQGVGLHLPEGVACGPSGQIVVGDTGNDRLVRFTYQDRIVSGGSPIEIPELSAPFRVQLNSRGEIFALDSTRRRIVRLDPAGDFANVISFEGAPPPRTVVPRDFTIDAADNLYVLDVFSARVLVLDPEGAFQRALPLPDGIGFVSGLAVDETGGIVLIDSIRRSLFAAAADATTFAAVGGDLTTALATMPTFVAVRRGSTFVLEGSRSSIVTFRRDGSFVARQLTQGWEEGSLNQPSQMCINDRDEAFIADRDNSRIQVFQLLW
jgi:streptogramin lyase